MFCHANERDRIISVIDLKFKLKYIIIIIKFILNIGDIF